MQLVARTQSELDKVTAQIAKDYGVEARGHSADLSDSAAIASPMPFDDPVIKARRPRRLRSMP